MKVKSLFVGALIRAAGAVHGVGAQEIQISKKRKLPPLPDLVVMRATYDQAALTTPIVIWIRRPGRLMLGII